MKRLIALILVFITVTILFACEEKNETGNPVMSDLVDVSVSDNALPPVSLVPEKTDSQVVAGDTYTLARCASGDILFTGNCAPIFRDKDSLCDCIYITAYNKTAAGIAENGRVRVTGEWKKLFSQSENWTDIVSVTIGNRFMAGLKSDGTVLSCGDNSYGKCETADIECAVKIAAGRNHLAVLLSDGSVIIKGANADADEVRDWKNIKDIVCGDFSVIGTATDGDILAFNAHIPSDWAGAESIQAYGSVICCLKDGKLLSNAEFSDNMPDTEGIESYSVSDMTIAVMYTDGRVVCAGDDEDMQNDTGLWRTGVVFDEKTGLFTGLGEKKTAQEAKRLIEKAIGRTVDFIANGEYVGTGTKVFDENKQEIGTIVIYGDVTGDGLIDDKDSYSMKQHIDGIISLTAEYEKAAHVLHFLSDVAPIGTEEIKKVTEHEAGYAHIKQFVYDPYHDDIVKYYNINHDTVGYIRVEGTQIDYPILYGDNYFYMDRDIYKHHTVTGSIVAAYSSYHKNNPVLGHNMRRSGRMFHGLHKIEDRGEKLLIFKNRVINVTIHGEYSKWELYAVYETGPKEPYATQNNNLDNMDSLTNEEITEWIEGQLARSTTRLGVDDVTYEDEFLTMYTCGDEYYSDPLSQSRLYMFFRRVG